jgi:hypothetical protein
MKLSQILPVLCFATLAISAPGALRAQDFYDPGTVNTIQLFFPQANWDQLLDNLVAEGEDGRLTGTAIINGVTYDSVGVRYKGNSSYNANRNKNPFNIKLDYVHDEQLLQGVYGTIKLANGFNDPSLLREALSYEIARKYMPASGANYANLYVNNQLIGVYTSVQDVDSHFMRTHLNCSGKPRFKCETNPTGNPVIWGYLGPDSTAYGQIYEMESDYGWDELIEMAYALNNDLPNLPNELNLDRHLWLLAFENLMDNFDSPINIMHNFYLFGDEDGRLNPIIWDLNESFGVFNHVGIANLSLTQLQSYNPLANNASSIHTLISRVLSNPRYLKMYIAHMRTMIGENFSNGWYATRGTELQGIVAPYVQADPNYFFSFANFLANLNTTITQTGPGGRIFPGITALMDVRSNFLLNHAAFAGTLPAISAIDHYPDEVQPNSTVQFTLTASDAFYAQLGLRQNIARKFEIHQMFDDGNHGDGAAGDGVFGVAVEVGCSDIQYYGWAENAAQGTFFPPRAEYEHLSIDLPAMEGALVVNEINYNSASEFDPEDWVELINPGAEALDISGWTLKDDDDGHAFVFPAGTVVPGNSCLVVCRSLSAFQSCFPDVTAALGDLDFGLSSSGDAVRIYDSVNELVDAVYYGVQAPWPTEPNGDGPSLELISPSLDNSLPENWQASSGYGTPGQPNGTVGADDPQIPPAGADLSAWPNPFNPSAAIEYSLPAGQVLDLAVYNLKGERIRTLEQGYRPKGTYSGSWDGTDGNGKSVSSGVYLLVLRSGGKILATLKLALLK